MQNLETLVYVDLNVSDDYKCLSEYLYAIPFKYRCYIENKHSNPKNKFLSISAYGLLFKVLQWNNIEYENCELDIGKYGKPYFKNLDVHFSISHSDNMIACAVSLNSKVGVDIQKKFTFILEYLDYFCNDTETGLILNSSNISLSMTSVWSKKEAYFKYCGDGITSFSSLKSFDTTKSCNDKYIVNWTGDDYALSVCSENAKNTLINVSSMKIKQSYEV